jgi:hypothetical protein
VNQVIWDHTSEGLQKRHAHKRSRAHLQGVVSHQKLHVSNDKENVGQTTRKISALRRLDGGENQHPLDSISINLSPPQQQFRNNKFTVRKTSDKKHHHSNDAKQHRPTGAISLQQSPNKLRPIKSDEQENISLRISSEQTAKRNAMSQPKRVEAREYRMLRQSNSLADPSLVAVISSEHLPTGG